MEEEGKRGGRIHVCRMRNGLRQIFFFFLRVFFFLRQPNFFIFLSPFPAPEPEQPANDELDGGQLRSIFGVPLDALPLFFCSHATRVLAGFRRSLTFCPRRVTGLVESLHLWRVLLTSAVRITCPCDASC